MKENNQLEAKLKEKDIAIANLKELVAEKNRVIDDLHVVVDAQRGLIDRSHKQSAQMMDFISGLAKDGSIEVSEQIKSEEKVKVIGR